MTLWNYLIEGNAALRREENAYNKAQTLRNLHRLHVAQRRANVDYDPTYSLEHIQLLKDDVLKNMKAVKHGKRGEYKGWVINISSEARHRLYLQLREKAIDEFNHPTFVWSKKNTGIGISINLSRPTQLRSFYETYVYARPPSKKAGWSISRRSAKGENRPGPVPPDEIYYSGRALLDAIVDLHNSYKGAW